MTDESSKWKYYCDPMSPKGNLSCDKIHVIVKDRSQCQIFKVIEISV